MEVCVQMKCPKCANLSRIWINTDHVGQMHNGFCPNCGSPIKFPISEELVAKLQAAIGPKKVKSQPPTSQERGAETGAETFVPSSQNRQVTPPAASDSSDCTLVPEWKKGQDSRILVLAANASEITPFQTIVIDQQYTIVGKRNSAGQLNRPDMEVVTQDKYMSKKHFLIKRMSKNDFAIEDYNSTNGTWLNDKRLAEGESLYLESGDRIRAGRTIFVVSFKNSD